MIFNSIGINQYFARIKYTDIPLVDEQTLKNIHNRQVFSIPFENLSIHELNNGADNVISLMEIDFQNKLIISQRGGYCFELNELLASVLVQLGFDVYRLIATVVADGGVHEILLIKLNGNLFISDAGFGGNGLLEPISLKVNTLFKQLSESFKLIVADDDYILQVFN